MGSLTLKLLQLIYLAAWAGADINGGGQCPSSILKSACTGYQSTGQYFDAVATPSIYDNTLRPACGNATHQGPTVVEVQLYLTQLNSVDPKQGTIEINGFFRTWWNDPRLAYNGTENGGCFDVVNLYGSSQSKIWQPDIYVDNLMQRTTKGTKSLVQIYPSGRIWRSEQVLLTVVMQFNLARLPYDEHKPNVVVASYSQDVNNMRVIPKGGIIGAAVSGIGLKSSKLKSETWEFPTMLELRSCRHGNRESAQHCHTCSTGPRRRPAHATPPTTAHDEEQQHEAASSASRPSEEALSPGQNTEVVEKMRVRRAPEAVKDGIFEQDILFIAYAKEIFCMFDKDESNDLNSTDLQHMFRHFNIYMSIKQVIRVANMYLRDTGNPTPCEETNCHLRFAQVTGLIVNIDSYNMRSAKDYRSLRALLDGVSPSLACDVFARFLFPVVVVLMFVVFYIMLALNAY